MGTSAPKPPRIRDRKLGRERMDGEPVVGLHWSDGLIEIDPRLDAKEYLATLVHELIHHRFPGATEQYVLDTEKLIVNALWRRGYRRIAK